MANLSTFHGQFKYLSRRLCRSSVTHGNVIQTLTFVTFSEAIRSYYSFKKEIECAVMSTHETIYVRPCNVEELEACFDFH